MSERERRTAPVHAVIRPTTAGLFKVWAENRGLTVSAAVEGLMVDALLRELTASPVGLLTRDLPPNAAARIETILGSRDTP